jgi:WD40 repeat protein
MGFFERHLVRPSHLELVEVLTVATREANEEGLLLDLDQEHWANFVAGLKTEEQGSRQWQRNRLPEGAGVVGVAWWTDYLGRRHFRIWAGSAADGSFSLLFCPERHPRPPVWHIAPDQVFARTRLGHRTGQNVREWLVVCPCGKVGTPEAIGWMGTCCGACHDAELQPARKACRCGGVGCSGCGYGITASPPIPCRCGGVGCSACGDYATQKILAGKKALLPLYSFHQARNPLHTLVFSPNGRWLAGVGEGRLVHRWDVWAGTYEGPIRTEHGPPRTIAFTAGGRLLAVAGSDRMVRFMDVVSGQEVSSFVAARNVLALAIAPDNLTLAMCGAEGLEIWGRCEVSDPWWLVDSLAFWEGKADAPARCLCFSEDGNYLAVGSEGHLRLFEIIERGGWVECFAFAVGQMRPFVTVQFLPAGNPHLRPPPPLVSFEGGAPGARERLLRSWQWPRQSPSLHRTAHTESAAARFSPDGNWLASVCGTAVCLEPVHRDGKGFQLECGPRQVLQTLAFSPDGETLATADAVGSVQLWPWRRLIQA